jgi:acyl-CoA reductase-like NAD-dependent aldehyde dehydrogenase
MLQVINPATGAVISQHQPDTERVAALRRFRDRLHADREVLARLLSEEVGKPIAQARAEIANTQRLEFFLEHTDAVLADERVLEDAAGPPAPGWRWSSGCTRRACRPR